MIYKVFYQESKNRSPRREQTHSLYLEVGKKDFEIGSKEEREQRITARELVEKNTPYHIEFIEPLVGKHLDYEKESGVFALTEF